MTSELEIIEIADFRGKTRNTRFLSCGRERGEIDFEERAWPSLTSNDAKNAVI